MTFEIEDLTVAGPDDLLRSRICTARAGSVQNMCFARVRPHEVDLARGREGDGAAVGRPIGTARIRGRQTPGRPPLSRRVAPHHEEPAPPADLAKKKRADPRATR